MNRLKPYLLNRPFFRKRIYILREDSMTLEDIIVKKIKNIHGVDVSNDKRIMKLIMSLLDEPKK